MNKNLIILGIVIIILVVGFYFLFPKNNSDKKIENNNMQKNQTSNTKSFQIQGMKVEILKEGSGLEAKTGDNVFVHYVGTLESGVKFDSSIDRGVPFDFVLGQNRVIQGWELGVLGMKIGEKRKLTIPPELGYGANAIGNIIPANSTLVFEVELLEIK